MGNKEELPALQRNELISTLQARFTQNMNRHSGLEWATLQAKLELSANSEKLWSLNEMESTGGEPDVVGFDAVTGEYIFYDCSAESPKGRRSICYDREGLEFKPSVNRAVSSRPCVSIQPRTTSIPSACRSCASSSMV